MMNEVEKHLKKFASENEVLCPHLKCKAASLVLPVIMAFKNHTSKVHKSSLHV